MKKFLVVVDMQKDFVDGALGSREAVAIVPAVFKNASRAPTAGSSTMTLKMPSAAKNSPRLKRTPLVPLTCQS